MARRRKGKRGKKRTKTYPIASTLGMVPITMQAVEAAKTDGLQGALRYGVRATSGFDIKGEVPWSMDAITKSEGGIMWGGILASTVLPKIPIIKTLPKKIPFIGKYLRW